MKNAQPSWVKPVVEIGPLIVFFASYKFGGFMVSTAAVIAATVIAATISYLMMRKIPPMLWVTLVVVVVFGGLLLGRSLLKPLMATALELDDAGWRKLTMRFALFFAFVAILNEIIWRTQPESIWVDFKAFGILGLNVIFILTQFPLIKRHQLKSD